MKTPISTMAASLRALLAFSVILGLAYPATITVVAMVGMPDRAGGSIVGGTGVVGHGVALGSALLAQATLSPAYMYPRPSAAGYATMPSGASNLGPTSAVLHRRTVAWRDSIAQRDGIPPGDVAEDLVTSSGSGLDPHISPQAALQQTARIALARGMDTSVHARLRALVLRHIDQPVMSILGEPRVNVLLLNIAIDSAFGTPRYP